MSNKQIIRRKILAAATSFVLSIASVALAQQQVNTDGHANDANPQIGSGGSNGDVSQQPINNGAMPSNIQQQGAVHYNATHGLLGNTRENENINQNINTPNGNNSHGNGGNQSFYLPPSGAILPPALQQPQQASQMSLSGNYIAPQQMDQMDLRISSLLDSNMNATPLPKPGELNMPGPVDPSAANTWYTNNWVYQLNAAQLGLGNQTNLPSTAQPGQIPPIGGSLNNPNNSNQIAPGQISGQGPVGPVEKARFDQVQQIRQQLYQSAIDNTNTTGANGPGTGAIPNQPPQGGSLQQGANPQQNNLSSALPNQPLSQSLGGGSQEIKATNLAAGPGDLTTGQSQRNLLDPMNLPTVSAQSKQFAELRKRLDAYNTSHPQSDEEANREFLAALKAYRKAVSSQMNGGVPNGVLPPNGVQPGTVTPTQPPLDAASPTNRGNDMKPLQVQDLASGIGSKGLSDLIHEAQTLVQSQQYSKAITVYDEAIGAAPNNSLLYIGRAEAELGASLYRPAEADIRTAFNQEKATLMGQYDLTGQLGEARLQYIESDLGQIASDSPQNPTPAFLLAFIAYNTHREAQANAYLSMVAKRNSSDELVPTLKRYWTLESATQPSTQPGINK